MGRCGVLVDGAKRLKIGDGINGKKGNKNWKERAKFIVKRK